MGAEPTPLAHCGGTSPILSVPTAPRAFSPSFKVPFLLGARPAAVPSQSSWPVPFVGPLLLLGLASSGTSHYPLHGAPLLSTHDRTPPFPSVLGSLAGPRVYLPSTRIRAARVQWRRKKMWRSRHGGLVGSLGQLLLPQAGRSWWCGAPSRPFTVMSGLRVDARGQQRPSLGALGS